METRKEHKKEIIELLFNMVIYFISLLIGMVLLALLSRVDIFRALEIYYYKMIANSILTIIILGIGLFVIKKIWNDKIKLNTIFSCVLLVGMALVLFITIGPLVIDRSYTIFSLADMAENQDTIFTKEEIEDRFSDIYIYQYDSIEKRIEEQLATGNIGKVAEGYKITEKGKKLIETFRLVEKIYPVEDERIIYPVYGDEQDEKN